MHGYALRLGYAMNVYCQMAGGLGRIWTMANDDELIEEVRSQEQRVQGAAKRDAEKRSKILREASKKALQAMRASDERAYAQALHVMNVHEGSAEWKLAWDLFRRNCGKP